MYITLCAMAFTVKYIMYAENDDILIRVFAVQTVICQRIIYCRYQTIIYYHSQIIIIYCLYQTIIYYHSQTMNIYCL